MNTSCIIKTGNKEQQGSINLSEMVHTAYICKEHLNAVKSFLQKFNERIGEEIQKVVEPGIGTYHIICDNIECTVVIRDKVKVKDSKGLKKYLGESRFFDLVRINIDYSPERKLIELAASEEKISDFLEIKEGKWSYTYKTC